MLTFNMSQQILKCFVIEDEWPLNLTKTDYSVRTYLSEPPFIGHDMRLLSALSEPITWHLRKDGRFEWVPKIV